MQEDQYQSPIDAAGKPGPTLGTRHFLLKMAQLIAHMLPGLQKVLSLPLTNHISVTPSLLREKTSDSDRQQRQLSYLAEMTNNFAYVAGRLNAAADTLSRLMVEEEDADEVCLPMTTESQGHWDKKD